MTDEQKKLREMVELRRFLEGRGLTVEACRMDGENMHVRVPSDQEAAFREAMQEWTKTRVAFYVKRPKAGG